MERTQELRSGKEARPEDASTLRASQPAQQPSAQAASDGGGSQQPDAEGQVVRIMAPLYQNSVKKLRLDYEGLTNMYKDLFSPELKAQVQAASAAGATVTIQKGGQAQVVPLLDAYLGLTISLEPPVPQLLQSSSSGGSGTGSGTSGGSGGGSGGGSANLFTRSCYNAFDDKLETETLVDAVEDMILLAAKANIVSTVVRVLMPQLITTNLARCKRLVDLLEDAARTSGSRQGRGLRQAVAEAQAEIRRLMRQCVPGAAQMLAAFTSHEQHTAGWLVKSISSAVAAVTAAQGDGGDVDACIQAYVEHAPVLSKYFLDCWFDLVAPQACDLEHNGAIMTNSFDSLRCILRQQIMHAGGLLGTEAEAARLLESIGKPVAGWDEHHKRMKEVLLTFQDHCALRMFMRPHGGGPPMDPEHLVLCSLAHAEEAGPEQTSMRLRTGKDEPALVGMQLPNEACALAGRLKLLGEEKAAGAQADA